MPDNASPREPAATRLLAEWAARVRYEDIPPETVHAAKRLLLDTLSVAWAGSAADGIDTLRRYATRYRVPAESRSWVHGEPLPATQAAFLNGVYAAALDFDSVHDRATVHADIVILPAVFALAERERADGKALLTALIVGDELLVRLGLAMQHHPGWFYSSVLGVIAAAAAAGRLLGAAPDALQHAMGIALSRAAGTQQPLIERSFTKRLQTAYAARDGIESALLAACGVTAPAQALEGRCGLSALYAGIDHAALAADLGRRYFMQELSVKKYPSCLCNHAAIEATLALVRDHDLRAADVAEAAVSVSPFMERLVGAPFDPGAEPQVAAQFSVRYSVACALARGRFTLADIDRAAALDPAVAALARRVQVEVDPRNDGKFAPATVAVKTVSGARFSRRVDQLPGSPGNPLSEAELRQKAAHCFARGAVPLDGGRLERFLLDWEQLHTLPDVSRWLPLPNPPFDQEKIQ